MKAVARLAAILVTGLFLDAGAEAASMQPYQMVRSLQRVQDRIADGDHAALPMQQKLLGIIDNRMRKAAPDDFSDPRNLQALLIYGLSGGNPKTLELLFSKLSLNADESRLGNAIVRYALGDFAAARSVLQDIDPKSLPPEVGPPVALVSATVTARDNPLFAVRMLDEARLLSPGTLIEEAALRRSIPLAAALGDTERLARASEQYVRRFLRSPYATQFVDTFVAAVVELHDTVDPGMVDDVTAQMSSEQARIVYLRLARKSAIEGYERLLAFASQKAMAHSEGADGDSDPRAVLYANMASVSSDNVDDVLAALNGIERDRLSSADRELLDAATAIAKAVLDEPRHTSAVTPPSEPTPAEAGPPQEAALENNDIVENEQNATAPAPPGTDNLVFPGDPVNEEADGYLKEMRSKLEDIDALLEEETAQ
ncbi:chemotaxis protein [Nitratireductor sp. L1-7-SE]|uniref:Chemotaxis protein n=1 Tax=Nitratireductor rhodophyticola TaxID=2854036 RepID=A0ABS7R9Q2_9HYPH|nr:chemotaxis protein [Nitratireductor rhodophyticola]MBY8917672.1 chemotaxis protein [Nitratireductor rhodophyticola]MBY8922383.1 chemotaxis protein [Nitratireductor rhodophyticola]